MKVVYALLTLVFAVLILQSFSNDNTIVFKKFDESLRRTDSMIHITKTHVQLLDSHHAEDTEEIDSLNQVICKLQKKQYIKVVHDTVYTKK
jgi:hypothetical protein